MPRIVVFPRNRPHFGAQLVHLPLLARLRATWPDHELRVVARHEGCGLYPSLPWVDAFQRVNSGWQEIAAARGADVLVCLHPSSGTQALAAMMARPALSLGFRRRRLLDPVWTHDVVYDETEYRALHFMRLLQACVPFDALEAGRACVAELAAKAVSPCPARERSRHVVLMPGAGGGEFKKWGIDNFLGLAAALSAWAGQGTLRFTVLLGPAEAAEARRVAMRPRPGITVCQQPPLADMAALIMSADLVVANDCGPSHLAQFAGVPLVSLFDCAKPEWFWARPGARCLVPDKGEPLSRLPLAVVHDACLQLLSRQQALRLRVAARPRLMTSD